MTKQQAEQLRQLAQQIEMMNDRMGQLEAALAAQQRRHLKLLYRLAGRKAEKT